MYQLFLLQRQSLRICILSSMMDNKVSFAGLCKLENSEFKEIEFDKNNVEGVFGNEHEIIVAKRVSNVIVDFLRLNIE
jgi:hypothetical protein